MGASLRAIFFGTPEIAVPALEALNEIADVCAVICQPDRPAGRGLTLRAPPIKQAAETLGLTVEQPKKIRTPEFAAWLTGLEADVALVMAYGRILPPSVLGAPKRGCMNLHASILPKYRGAAPITWAIVRGETETGISLMQMDEGCDTGPVFSRHRIPIGPNDNAEDVFLAVAQLGRRVVESDLCRAVEGDLVAATQDHADASEAPMLTKNDGRIDWSKSVQSVHDHCRGMTPWPGASTLMDSGKKLKVLATHVVDGAEADGASGTVLVADRKRIEVACGTGVLAIDRAQLEGRKALPAQDLVAGRTLAANMVLGVAATGSPGA